MKKPKSWRIEPLGWVVSSLDSGISESGEERSVIWCIRITGGGFGRCWGNWCRDGKG